MNNINFRLIFDGYWREANKHAIPEISGIYNVYTCVHNKTKNSVTIKKHIYTGESENVKARLSNHEKQKTWEKHLKPGETLCFSFAKAAPSSRVRCEAAIINRHKPPVNTEYVQSFPFSKTIMHLEGEIRLLQPSFVVYPS